MTLMDAAYLFSGLVTPFYCLYVGLRICKDWWITHSNEVLICCITLVFFGGGSLIVAADVILKLLSVDGSQ